MAAGVDFGLEFFRQALALRGYRQQILTADIANASTPGFKAVDLDFRQTLAAAAGPASTPAEGRPWLVDDARDFGRSDGGSPPDPAAAVAYQADTAVTLDGNSVSLAAEKSAAAENAVQYEAAASFAAQMIKMLSAAINGSAAAAGS